MTAAVASKAVSSGPNAWGGVQQLVRCLKNAFFDPPGEGPGGGPRKSSPARAALVAAGGGTNRARLAAGAAAAGGPDPVPTSPRRWPLNSAVTRPAAGALPALRWTGVMALHDGLPRTPRVGSSTACHDSATSRVKYAQRITSGRLIASISVRWCRRGQLRARTSTSPGDSGEWMAGRAVPGASSARTAVAKGCRCRWRRRDRRLGSCCRCRVVDRGWCVSGHCARLGRCHIIVGA